MNYIFSSAPGFRFQPTPQQLITEFLAPKARGDNVKHLLLMAEVNLCKHEPWDLPDKSIIKSDDEEWYFFCPRDLKSFNSKCSNRRTKAGFWKSTCRKKPIKDKRTKKVIGIRKTLVFYKTARPKAKRTGWIIYEYDIITDSSLSYNKGQYVLCRLKKKSEDEKIKKGEQNRQIAPVSDYEAEPSQSMASDYEDKSRSEMTLKSACNESKLSHHVASDHFENQNSNELVNNSACQVSEFSHYMASDFRNQNSNKLMSNSAYDGSGSSHSPTFNSETQYLNQPTVDSAYNGSKSHYKAFDSETQISNNIIIVPTDEDRLLAFEKWLMTPDLKNQELPFQHEGKRGPSVAIPSEFIKKLTSDSESTSLMAFDFNSQNLDKEIDISAFDEGDWSSPTATPPDFGNQNPCKKTDMSSTLEEDYSSFLEASFSDNDLADVALPEVSPELLAELERFFEQDNSPNTALDQLPVCMEESHSYMAFDACAST